DGGLPQPDVPRKHRRPLVARDRIVQHHQRVLVSATHIQKPRVRGQTERRLLQSPISFIHAFISKAMGASNSYWVFPPVNLGATRQKLIRLEKSARPAIEQ